ncbi:GIY-YIG nuclease family protein [bacterium]|nr:GIY-YIG nuclease family protein [bacterium]
MNGVHWFVWVIQSSEGLNYVGMTRNLERRIMNHNSGLSKWTRRGTNWNLVYYEKFVSATEARVRERYFKNTAGREWLQRRGYL